MHLLLDDLTSAELIAGVACGLAALAVCWRLGPAAPPWGASLTAAVLAAGLIVQRQSLGGALALGGLALAGVSRRRPLNSRVPRLAWPVAAGLCLALIGGVRGPTWVRFCLVPGVPLIGFLLHAAEQRIGRWTALLFGLSALGLYAGLPDTEPAQLLCGASLVLLPMVVMRGGAHLNRGGADALAALFLWAAATGAGGRPQSFVGGVACLGILLVVPLTGRSPVPVAPTPMLLTLQSLLVVAGSRFTAVASTSSRAAGLAAAFLAIALACLSVIRKPG